MVGGGARREWHCGCQTDRWALGLGGVIEEQGGGMGAVGSERPLLYDKRTLRDSAFVYVVRVKPFFCVHHFWFNCNI